MKNKQIFGIASLALVTLLMISMVSAFYPGMGYSNEDKDLYDKIDKAIEDNDYDEWKKSIVSTLTKDNFNKLVESQKNMKKMDELGEKLMKAWEAGDEDKVRELEKEMMKFEKNLFGDEFLVGGNIIVSEGVIGGIHIDESFPEFNLSKEDQDKLNELDKKIMKALDSEDWDELEKLQEEMDKIIGVEFGHGVISSEIISEPYIDEDPSFWSAFRFW